MMVSWGGVTTMVRLLMEAVMLICMTRPVYSNRIGSPVFIEPAELYWFTPVL